MKEQIILIGGGGHCRSCIDVIEQAGNYEIAGIVDVPEKMQHNAIGYPVIGSDADLSALIKKYPNVLITLGHIKSPVRRIELFNDLKNMGAHFPVIKSPLSYVSHRAQIDEGTIVMHHAFINVGARIGRNCIINTKSIIEHDAIINDHCHISTGAIVNGGVRVGKGSFFGSGAVSREYITISANTFIRANSLVSNGNE